MKKNLCLCLLICFSFLSRAQAPNPALVGYFQNWQDANATYIQLDQVDARYNVIDVAFAVPQNGTEYKMEFIPDQVSQSTFISQMQTLQSQGKKVIISIGGATAPVSLGNIAERDTFISTMTNILSAYNFDGMDIDLEGGSLSLTGGTIAVPVDAPVINLIYAIKQIMGNYFSQTGHKLILTMAPETAGVQGGQSAYGGIWGAHLPVIDALRDSLELIHVQLYNSGSQYGLDGQIYTQSTADFIVAMCEAVIRGFNTSGGMFTGLPANKVAVGLPACSMAAGSGFTDTLTVKNAIDYLRGDGPQPGSYSLINANGYPDLRGMMTWSINWDAVATCGSAYEYARNFQNIFGTATSVSIIHDAEKIFSVYPVPADQQIIVNVSSAENFSGVKIYNVTGVEIFSERLKEQQAAIDAGNFENGIYFVKIESQNKTEMQKLVIEHSH